jgi:hypothetical protein
MIPRKRTSGSCSLVVRQERFHVPEKLFLLDHEFPIGEMARIFAFLTPGK